MTTEAERLALPPQWILLTILAGLGMVGPFSIDTMFPAFAQMAVELSTTPLALQQLISVYLLSFAVMSLFHGPLSDAVGRKPVVLGGVGLFVLASLACALAPNLAWLLVGRAVQGLSAGAGQIISRAMVRDIFIGDRAQQVMSQIAMIFGLAPALAPIVGGWLLVHGDWRGIFWFLAVLGAVLLAMVWVFLPETHPAQDRTPLRVRPLFASLWSVWCDPDGRRLALTAMVNFAGMFLYISSAPMFVVRLLGKGEQDFWVLFVPLISGMVVGSWVSGRLAGRVTRNRLATGGYWISLVGGTANLVLMLVPATRTLPLGSAAASRVHLRRRARVSDPDPGDARPVPREAGRGRLGSELRAVGLERGDRRRAGPAGGLLAAGAGRERVGDYRRRLPDVAVASAGHHVNRVAVSGRRHTCPQLP